MEWSTHAGSTALSKTLVTRLGRAPARGFVTPILLVFSRTPEALFDDGFEGFHGACNPRSSIR